MPTVCAERQGGKRQGCNAPGGILGRIDDLGSEALGVAGATDDAHLGAGDCVGSQGLPLVDVILHCMA